MARRKQKWSPGDVFVVEQQDGLCTVGQVLDQMMPNVVRCAYFDLRVSCSEAAGPFDLAEANVIALLALTREMLDSGRWRVVGRQSVAVPESRFPNEQYRERGWIGAKMFDAVLAEEFLNAFYGLRAWDDWHDPHLLDKLLISPDRKPKHLLLVRKQVD